MKKIEAHNHFELDFHLRTDFDFRNVELNTCIVIDEALRRGMKAEFVLGKYLEVTYKGRKALFHISDNSSLGYLAQRITASKSETKEFLKRAGISAPQGRRFIAAGREEIIEFASSLPEPWVVKPEFGSEGSDVYCDVTENNIAEVVRSIGKRHRTLVFEEQVQGNEYRVFATITGYIGVSMRRPASVLGDGTHTIKELIDEKNRDRQYKHQFPIIYPFSAINIDEIVLSFLHEQGMDTATVPLYDQRVYLRRNSNISTGGDSISISAEDVHPKMKEIAMAVLTAIPGMSYAGIDIMTDDITQYPENYHVLEVNNMPGIKILRYPYIGNPQNPAGQLLDIVFP